jgi:transcriptional regulator with XRE-family HTH domain
MGTDFGEQLRALMADRSVTGRSLARHVPCDAGLISRLINGKQRPSQRIAARLDEVLDAGGSLAALSSPVPVPALADAAGLDDEIAALELSRRASATDVGEATVVRLELAVDGLAVAYHRSPPAELLERIRSHLGYVARLLGGRASLDEHRRLLVSGAWLSLLAATCLIDLDRRPAALAHLRTAAQLARETGNREVAGWAVETRAWDALTQGDYPRAAVLALEAQHAAPAGSSAFIQATAQEGRAWARLGAKARAHDALARTEVLASRLAAPDQPEHHYRYDPAKAEAYVATTLSWLSDPAAETYARQVLIRMEGGDGEPPRLRRAASARLDLGLALAAVDKLDEAAVTALDAVNSGLLVPSNYWRAAEVIAAVDGRGVPEARELGEAYRELCAPPS